ncbi:MAG: dTDP-4-dehydrorhamnose reductase [Bacteroidota bacterium]
MNILVTGSNGQLGSEIKVLSEQFSQHHYFFTDIEELDICDSIAVENYIYENKINLIINCAAYTAVDKAEQEPELAFKINAQAVENICVAALKHAAFLIHISTDYVYDGKKDNPYLENNITNPISVYGKSKLKGEEIIIAHKLPALILRTSWLYSSFGSNFVKTILGLLKEKSRVNIISDQIGTPTYAADLAKIILDIITHEDLPTHPEIYHFSDDGITTWYEFALLIAEIMNSKTFIHPISTKEYPTPATRPQFSLLSKEKIKHDFNIQIPFWQDSLKKCLAIIEENELAENE